VTDTRLSHAGEDPGREGPGLPASSDRLCRLAEAGGYEVVADDELLEQFYEHIVRLVVFPRIFTIMSARPGSVVTAPRSR
jgi:hypothetical protein